MKKILKAIDTANEFMGRAVRWIGVLIILIVCAEVAMRYLLGKPTIQLPEIAVMAGAAFYTLSWGYIYLHRRHVRVDVLYVRLPARGQAVIDVVGGLLFLLPLATLLTYASWNWAWHSWKVGEFSPMTYWYPILGPIRSVVFIGLVFFALQGFAQFFRDIYLLVRGKAYD